MTINKYASLDASQKSRSKIIIYELVRIIHARYLTNNLANNQLPTFQTTT